MVVKKADGTPRFCVDFRRLNAISRRDAFPLARIDDVLDCVGGALTNTDRESMLMSLGGNGTQCVLDIQIEKDMKAPTYIYYELHNYYQNHRRCVTQPTRWYRNV